MDDGNGDTYPDQDEIFKHSVKGRSYEYLKIRLEKSDCTKSLYFQFAFPSDIENFVYFVEYDSDSKYDGSGHFHKRLEDKSENEETENCQRSIDNLESEELIDTLFMIGECLYNIKNYEAAAEQYQKILAPFPYHAKAAPAMLKQAMAYENLKDRDTAKILYKKVKKKHGASPEAAIAEKKLQELK